MKKAKKSKNVSKIFLFTIVFLFLTIVISFFILWISTPLDQNALALQNLGVQVYNDNNELISAKLSSTKSFVNINELSQHTINAFVAVEDKNFYNHSGISVGRILKSAIINLEDNKSQGGSTITQQLIKNALLTNEKTYTRKAKEGILSLKLEDQYSKDEILEAYLNTIYFGEGSYGIEDAAGRYFEKSASELTIAESAVLSAIIKSPAIYSPTTNYEKNNERKDIIIKLMYEQNLITLDEYDSAINETVSISDKYVSQQNSYASMAILECCEILKISENSLLQSGYQIETYLNDDIQNSISLGENDINKMQIIADNERGGVLAYNAYSKYNLSNLKRQPASTVKPVFIYGPAINENIITQNTPLLDEPINIDGYNPQNYNDTFIGYTNVSNSLQKSLNIPTIKVLSYLSIDTAKDYIAKYNSDLKINDDGYSIALGSIDSGVHPLDILEWYSVFSNEGKCNEYKFVKYIKDADGNVLYKHIKNQIPILDNESAYLTSDILNVSPNVSATKRLTDVSQNLYSKTGTASVDGNNTDYFNVTFDKKYSIISWIGTDSNSEYMPESYTSSASATIMTANTLKAANLLHEQIEQPDNVISVKYSLNAYNENHILTLANDDESYFLGLTKKNNDILFEKVIDDVLIDRDASAPSKNGYTEKKKVWWYV